MRASRVLAIALVVLVSVMPVGIAAQDSGAGDALGDVTVLATDQQGGPADGVDVAVRLSQLTYPDADARVVQLASSATFVDALSASVAQSDGPLLLTPPDGLPAVVRAELIRLRPQVVLLLGGTAALSSVVEDEVAELGLLTQRLAGPSRIETAAAVARAAADPAADTAIVVRAFDAQGGNGSAAWADSVTVGALAAGTGFPVLLTESSQLSPATVEEIDRRGIQQVLLIGGEAAISAGVHQALLGDGYRVQRIAGRNRAETALAVAAARGVTPGARAVVVEGIGELGWQAGIAAAGHVAATGATLLPTDAQGTPPAFGQYLAASPPAAFTCIAAVDRCQQARSFAGMAPRPVVSYNPAPGSALAPGEFIVVGVDDPERQLPGEAEVASDCAVSSIEYLPEGAAAFSLSLDEEEPGGDQPGTAPIPAQPDPGSGEATGPTQPVPTQTVEPLDPNEPAPADPPLTTCMVTTTFLQQDGTTLVDRAAFHVVDLRPRIRVTNFRQVEGDPVTFLDRSDGIITSWDWGFGDGASSAARHPDHTYARRGCVDVGLRVRSPFAHWSTGQQFEDVEVRTLAIDPADTDTRLEVRLLDEGVPVAGEEVQVTGPGNSERRATTRGDGRAVFDDLAPGDWLVEASSRGGTPFVQRVVPGHTLCPVMAVGPVGDLLVTVRDAEEAPISGATVRIAVGETTVAGGLTDVEGHFLAADLPVGEYQVTATADGEAVGSSTTASVVANAITPVVVQEVAESMPTPSPQPTPTDPPAGG